MSTLAKDFLNALLAGDRVRVKQIYSESSSQMDLIEFIENILLVSMEEMGVGWENGSIALSQIYMSGRICEELIDEILPPGSCERKEVPKMAIGVLNDFHMLGKRIVYSILRASGYQLQDYGRVDVDQLVGLVKSDHIEILLLSVLMLPSALMVKDLRARFEQEGIKVKIIVGGAPFRFDSQLWQEVGADGVGYSAADAVSVIESVGGRHP